MRRYSPYRPGALEIAVFAALTSIAACADPLTPPLGPDEWIASSRAVTVSGPRPRRTGYGARIWVCTASRATRTSAAFPLTSVGRQLGLRAQRFPREELESLTRFSPRACVGTSVGKAPKRAVRRFGACVT